MAIFTDETTPRWVIILADSQLIITPMGEKTVLRAFRTQDGTKWFVVGEPSVEGEVLYYDNQRRAYSEFEIRRE